jgi:glycosyltransferase involved in cell wall biosynthesis
MLNIWAQKNSINHIHVHFANPGSTVVLIASKMGIISFSISIHGPDEFYDETRLLIREKLLNARFVRCISFYSRSQLFRLIPYNFWSKIHIVRCGLFEHEFQATTTSKNDKKQLLCVGRLSSNKGQAVLIKSANILREKGLIFEINFLGGGDDLKLLESLVTELGLDSFIKLIGPVGHDKVKEYLLNSDLFILPSFAEGIPVALMEAMAAGVPVISTNITGIPELIEHGVDGLLVQPSNEIQLADAIELILKKKIDIDLITWNAREKIKRLYNVEKNTQILASIFQESLQ